jgi:uncharacterized protein Yka (UPF0111/DUF47 family)
MDSMEQVVLPFDKYDEMKRKLNELDQALFSLDEAEEMLKLVINFIKPEQREDLLNYVHNSVVESTLDRQLFFSLKDFIESLD